MTRTKRDEAAGLRLGFSWIGALGVILVLAGLVGLFSTAFAPLTSMLPFGRLLLTGGVVGLLHGVQARGTNFFWLGVVAALNIAAGVVIIRRPEAGAEALPCSARCCPGRRGVPGGLGPAGLPEEARRARRQTRTTRITPKAP